MHIIESIYAHFDGGMDAFFYCDIQLRYVRGMICVGPFCENRTGLYKEVKGTGESGF